MNKLKNYLKEMGFLDGYITIHKHNEIVSRYQNENKTGFGRNLATGEFKEGEINDAETAVKKIMGDISTLFKGRDVSRVYLETNIEPLTISFSPLDSKDPDKNEYRNIYYIEIDHGYLESKK